MKTRRYIFIFAGILVLGVVVYFLFFNQEATTQVSVKVSKGQFPIEITTSGELLAKRSEKILGPDGLRQFQIYQIKIVDIIPDGTIVDSGQYVATLDRSEISNKIKDEENNLEKLESQLVKTKLDTALNLRSARDELINLKYDLEQRKLELEQSKFEPPAAIRQAQIALEKADRSYNQAGKNYQLRLDKALKYGRLAIFGNANPRIGYRDNNEILSFAFDAHDNTSLRRRKFDSVIDELVQHPGDFLRIGLHERYVLIDPDL